MCLTTRLHHLEVDLVELVVVTPTSQCKRKDFGLNEKSLQEVVQYVQHIVGLKDLVGIVIGVHVRELVQRTGLQPLQSSLLAHHQSQTVRQDVTLV